MRLSVRAMRACAMESVWALYYLYQSSLRSFWASARPAHAETYIGVATRTYISPHSIRGCKMTTASPGTDPVGSHRDAFALCADARAYGR